MGRQIRGLVKGLSDGTGAPEESSRWHEIGMEELELPKGTDGSGLRISPDGKFRHGFPVQAPALPPILLLPLPNEGKRICSLAETTITAGWGQHLLCCVLVSALHSCFWMSICLNRLLRYNTSTQCNDAPRLVKGKKSFAFTEPPRPALCMQHLISFAEQQRLDKEMRWESAGKKKEGKYSSKTNECIIAVALARTVCSSRSSFLRPSSSSYQPGL
jgi:hypothetical protein